MYIFITALALLAIAIFYGYEQIQRRPKEDKFEPEEIGDLDVEKGAMLECTESYGEFTKGFTYIVRVEYGGALVVWNDETKPVLAAGLDPRKFRIIGRHVDGTAAMPVKCDCKDGINMNCRECNEKIRRDS